MSILLGSWVKAKQSRRSSQVPFLIAAVIECNRFTAATVRQDTFSWYPFEWNDLTKWNLSPVAVEPLTREKRRTSYQMKIAYSLNEYFQWCANFCQSQTKMNEPIIIVSIEYIPNLFFFSLTHLPMSLVYSKCFTAHSLCANFLMCHVFTNGCHATIREIYICIPTWRKKDMVIIWAKNHDQLHFMRIDLNRGRVHKENHIETRCQRLWLFKWFSNRSTFWVLLRMHFYFGVLFRLCAVEHNNSSLHVFHIDLSFTKCVIYGSSRYNHH